MKRIIKKPLALLLAACILLVGVFTGCSEPEAATKTMIDQAGREVSIPTEVSRIVSLWPEATRVIYILNTADRLVGIDDGSITCPMLTRAFPEIENISNVGSTTKGTISTEEIAQLSPDIIFTRTDDPDLADRIQESLGVPVVCIRMTPPALNAISYEFISVIGSCIGEEERAAEVQAYLENRLAEITSVTSTIPEEERPLVYQCFSTDLLRTKGWDDEISLAGGISAAGGVANEPWYSVSMENVLEWNPEFIILAGFGKFMPEDLAADSQWQLVRAVQEGKVYRTKIGHTGKDPGGFLINVIQNAKVFYPDRFDYNCCEEGDEIFKELYRVDGLFTQLVQDYEFTDIDGE